MWDRYSLKQYAKSRLRTNYWRMVLAAFIFLIVMGGSASLTYKSSVNNIKQYLGKETSVSSGIYSERNALLGAIDDLADLGGQLNGNSETKYLAWPIAIIAMVIALVVIALGIAITVFLRNPLKVGGVRFFMENHSADANIDTFGLAFRAEYKNIVMTMFMMDLYTYLWTLLLIIPGIVKSYEYRMIPYILADNPGINREEAFELSKQMMMGNKWDAFVLDLSFIGWNILDAFTFGILGIFYVNPFRYQTNAELYLALRGNPIATEGTLY